MADGCFSKFRKELVKSSPQLKSHFVGLLMKHCSQSKSNYAELVLGSTISPILIYQISSTHTRILVDVRGGMPKNIRSYLVNQVAPQLPGKKVMFSRLIHINLVIVIHLLSSYQKLIETLQYVNSIRSNVT